jgi:hypothetical protein
LFTIRPLLIYTVPSEYVGGVGDFNITKGNIIADSQITSILVKSACVVTVWVYMNFTEAVYKYFSESAISHQPLIS